MSNAASVIVTIGAIFIGLCGMAAHLAAADGGDPFAFQALGALAGLGFVGSLVGYTVGHRRGDDEAYTSIVGALTAGFGAPLLIAVVVLLLNLLGFFK
jgi:hypothetical protein